MCSHVPTKGEQMVRYDGFCNKVSRSKRKKLVLDSDRGAEDADKMPRIIDPDFPFEVCF